MAAISATDLQAEQLICLLDCERRVMTVQWEDTLKQWTVRHGLVLGSPLHEGNTQSQLARPAQSPRYAFLDNHNSFPCRFSGRFRLPTIPPEAVFVVGRKGSRGPLGFRSLR